MSARYYDPGLSRFTQPDSVVPEPDDPQSWNRYSYTRNNPVNRIDPTGHADISTAADVADRWQGMADQSEAALNDWVEGGGMVRVATATATQTAIDLGSGMADMLRLGQGAAEGGWKGYATDALRATGLLGPVASGVSSVARGISAEISAARTVAREIAAAKAAAEAAKRAAGVRASAAQGKAFEARVAAEMEAEGWNVAREVTLQTPGGARTRMDIVGTRDGADDASNASRQQRLGRHQASEQLRSAPPAQP